MTSELIERLSDDTAARTAYEAGGYVNWDRQPDEKKDRHRRIAAAVLGQAADRIEALEAENARLREALTDILDDTSVVARRVAAILNKHWDTFEEQAA